MKEYSTKEMKAGFEPSVSDVKEAADVKIEKAIIEEKRGRYIVRDLNGQLLGKFLSKKDADSFVKKL